MNSYQLRITGNAELGQQLDTTKSLRVGFDCDVYSVEKLDDQNGNYTIRYKAKISSPIDCMEGQKIWKGKDKSKASQRLRWRLEAKALELGVDPEEFYQSEMNKIINAV